MNKKFLSLVVLLILTLSVYVPFFSTPTEATPNQFTTSQINGHYYQRHTWYSNGRFWVLYSDGVNTVYQSSSDSITWLSKVTFCTGNAFTQRCNVALSSNGLDVSIVSVNAPNGFFYRMGTCNSDGTITWHGAGYTYNIDATEVCITLDSLNYPYILYNRSPESAWFSQRSTTNDGTFTLGAEGVQYVGSIAGGDVEGNTMPLPAQEMYSIYTLQHTSGILYGTLENPATHMWGAPEAITATSVAAYRFSMISDGTVIYLSYCDLTTNHAYLYLRNSAGTWINLGDISSEAIIDTPAIIRDITYGGAWIFWADAATNIKAVHCSSTGVLGTVRTIKYHGVPVVETGILGLEIDAITGLTNHVGIIYPTASGTSFDRLSIYSDFIISNMMGSDAFGDGLKVIKTEEKYYSFELSIWGISTDPVNYASIRFYNNGHLIQVDYNATTTHTTVVAGNDYILLHEAQATTSGDTLTVKWEIWLKSTCVDKENMDIETYFSTLSGLNAGWDMYDSYCSLYNLGGWVSSTSSGSSTATSTTTTIATTTITQSSTTFYTTSLTTSPNTVTTTSVSSSTSTVVTTSGTAITTTLTTTCTTVPTTSLTSITTSTTVYSTSTTSSTVITTTKSTASIINGAAGHIPSGDTLDIFANTNAYAKAQIEFHNLQNVHALVSLYTGTRTNWFNNPAYSTPYKFGLDYWTGTTLCTGWRVEIQRANNGISWIGDVDRVIQWNVSWYFNDVLQKTDTIYSYPKVASEGETNDFSATTNFVIDFWLNKMNSSSVVGGRVSTEFYSIHAQTNVFLIWLVGSNWGPLTSGRSSSSLFFHNLIDSSGKIISCRDVDMSYFWDSVEQDNNNRNDIQKIENWNVLDFGITRGQMIGINTPQFVEPKTPDLPQNGFFNSLWAGLQQSIQGVTAILSDSFGWLGDAAYHFIDSILAYFGLSGLFETIITMITDLWANLSLLLLNTILFFVNILAVTYSFFGFGMTWVVAFATTIVQLIGFVVAILQGTSTAVTGLGDIWTKLNLTVAIPLIVIVLLVEWFISLDERTAKYGIFAWLKLAIDEGGTFIGVFMGIAQFVLQLFMEVIMKIIFYIREMLPKIAGTG
jgi:hypothetical protein